MITQKQQALIVIALSNLGMQATRNAINDGTFRPKLDEVKIFHDSLQAVRPAAEILTDDETLSLIASSLTAIMKLPVSDIKITPDVAEVPLQ